jgi:hypothetical protein
MKENETKENKSNLFEKFFHCCLRDNSEEIELINEENPYSDNYLLSKAKKEIEDEFSIFPVGLILEEERHKIEFTEEGLIKYITNLQNLNYENVYNKNGLEIFKRNSSNICEKFPLIRCKITKKKSEFVKNLNILNIINSLTIPELRKQWDDNIIEYKIIDKLNDNSEIIKIITKKQLNIISEKEFYDKRIMISKGDVYYLFSSSIPDSNNLISLDYDKAKNYLNVVILNEDKQQFYFDCFNQIDVNTEIPENFINTNLPKKIESYFNKYFEFLNSL